MLEASPGRCRSALRLACSASHRAPLEEPLPVRVVRAGGGRGLRGARRDVDPLERVGGAALGVARGRGDLPRDGPRGAGALPLGRRALMGLLGGMAVVLASCPRRTARPVALGARALRIAVPVVRVVRMVPARVEPTRERQLLFRRIALADGRLVFGPEPGDWELSLADVERTFDCAGPDHFLCFVRDGERSWGSAPAGAVGMDEVLAGVRRAARRAPALRARESRRLREPRAGRPTSPSTGDSSLPSSGAGVAGGPSPSRGPETGA